MEKGTMQFNIDTVSFMNEIVECALMENQGVLKVPLNIFMRLLHDVSKRATELNDPQLNILMLRLGLYEVHPKDVAKTIQQIEKSIKKSKK